MRHKNEVGVKVRKLQNGGRRKGETNFSVKNAARFSNLMQFLAFFCVKKNFFSRHATLEKCFPLASANFDAVFLLPQLHRLHEECGLGDRAGHVQAQEEREHEGEDLLQRNLQGENDERRSATSSLVGDQRGENPICKRTKVTSRHLRDLFFFYAVLL